MSSMERPRATHPGLRQHQPESEGDLEGEVHWEVVEDQAEHERLDEVEQAD